MIYKDNNNLPVDQTGDGGDSCFRFALLSIYAGDQAIPSTAYMIKTDHGNFPVRHPLQKPWNNEKNFSRDQLVVYMSALYFKNEQFQARRIFKKLMKRLFFCFNTERDYPGSKKFPWPHAVTENGKDYELRYFDGPDILMPDVIWFLAKCSDHWLYYLLYPFCAPLLMLSIFIHSKSAHKEHHQILSICLVMGKFYVNLFKKLVKNWEMDIKHYWVKRNEYEYAYYIIDHVNKV